jgi:outer membrane protein OmpA-like peptidoglycan-associated protein
MATLMDSILGMVTPEMKQALASRLGESPQAVQGGLGTATAATLSGLATKASDSGFLNEITGLLGGTTGQSLLGSLPSIAATGPTGGVNDLVNKFLPLVFGTQQSQVANAVAQQAGVGSASGTNLLKMAVPLVLGYLAKLHASGALTTSSLGNMLRAEAPSLQSYLPTSLLSSATSAASATAGRAASAVQERVGAVTSSGPRWLVPVAILGALLLAWLVIRSMSGPREPVQTAANAVSGATNKAATAAGNAVDTAARWAALGDMIKVKLPDGTEINVPSQGVEVRLVNYLNDASAPISETTWFDFDRLLFDTGQATLQPASQEQLANIATILKAYPQVKIRVGGYTDNTGDPAANLQLSEQRANSVMAELTRLGIDPSRIDAKGYGQDNPIADNSTEEGRQQNRRISLRVTDKPTSG